LLCTCALLGVFFFFFFFFLFHLGGAELVCLCFLGDREGVREKKNVVKTERGELHAWKFGVDRIPKGKLGVPSLEKL